MPGTRLCLALLLLLGCARVLALDLYSGEVLVSGQSAEERTEAVPAALIQVLQKLSGSRVLPTGPALDAALLSANRITVSFHYLAKSRVAPDGSSVPELWLSVRFLPDAVDRIAHELSLPRWRKDRQPVTIYVVVDDGLGRRLKPVEYAYAWDSLAAVATARGLPVSWPEPGEQTDRQPDLQLLWGGFTEQLVDNAGRGQDVAIIAARREGPLWNVRWTYASGEDTDGWRHRDRDLSFALAQGIHQLTDLVVSRNSIAASELGAWRFVLDVSGIAGAADYVRCLAYLEAISLVEKVTVREAEPGAARFVLELNAQPRYFTETLERDAVFVAAETGDGYLLRPLAATRADGVPLP